MEKTNHKIRNAAKAAGVRQWEIALHLGIGEQTLLRWLRVPLSAEKERMIVCAIEELVKEKENR